MHELYLNQKTRNKRFKELQEQGLKIRKTTTRNQQLHPEYIHDYEQETGIKLTAEDKGFGNNIYQTYFKVLYVIDETFN